MAPINFFYWINLKSCKFWKLLCGQYFLPNDVTLPYGSSTSLVLCFYSFFTMFLTLNLSDFWQFWLFISLVIDNLKNIVNNLDRFVFLEYTLFFIRTSKFCLRLAVLNFFFIFEAEMFLICSYFPDWTLQCHKEECQTEYNKNTLFHFFHSFSFKQRT